MDQARPTRKLLDWKAMGTRPVGRRRQPWEEDVMEDYKKLKIKNWKETAKDRRTWRDLVEKAKTQRVVVPNGDDEGTLLCFENNGILSRLFVCRASGKIWPWPPHC